MEGKLVDSIHLILDNMKKCLDNNIYIGAVSLALILPDICGKIENPNLRSGDRYRRWFDKWIGPFKDGDPISNDMPYLKAELVYKLRCSVLHSGDNDIEGNYKDYTLDNFILKIEKSNEFDIYTDSYGIITDNDGSQNTYICVDIRNLCNYIKWGVDAFLKNENNLIENQPKFRIIDWDEALAAIHFSNNK